jgi:hypothetical protein
MAGEYLLLHMRWIARCCECAVTVEGIGSSSSLVGSCVDSGPQRQPLTRPASAGGAAKRHATMLADPSVPSSSCRYDNAAWLQSLNVDVRTDYKIHSESDPAHTHVVMEFKTPNGLGIRRSLVDGCHSSLIPPSTKQNRAAEGSVTHQLGQQTSDTGVADGRQFGALRQLVTQMLHYCAPCGVLFDGIDFVCCSLRRDLSGEDDSKVLVVRYYVCRYSDEGDMPTFHQCLHYLIAKAKEMRPEWIEYRKKLIKLLDSGQNQAGSAAHAVRSGCAQRVGCALAVSVHCRAHVHTRT